ncbi:uncharacterized protein LOC111384931 [Olea europaea var. sylvestris]|uniref:uncharacterized protein LOC111384931 n=1 Tax=Olea europaea var. sylvestris TaxID=158386 RepID=UPI000C1CD7E9|nr:uncharacterized protein LOC111384931 [Olea europaea var. sylvestris]
MKFFTKLALCWGGATVSPAAETTISGQEVEHWPRNFSHEHAASGVRKIKPCRNWKPNLHAISEDRPISDLNQRTARSDRNHKVKPKSTTQVVPPPSHLDNYWKSNHSMALPTFSPTPFMI